MNIKRDENQVTVGAGYGNAIECLRTDPVTGRLLVDFVIESASNPTLKSRAYKDENFVNTSIAVTDDVSQTISPLLVKTSSGRLLVDLSFT